MIMCGNMTTGTGERSGAGAGTPPHPPREENRAEGGDGRIGLIIVAYVTINSGA